ncbi:MAG: ribonuclease H-like domain-containing protein [Acidobacteria bacterium]|nr:ribonuclease H-like domain-containing protein [Acidobacteriota bacterium]
MSAEPLSVIIFDCEIAHCLPPENPLDRQVGYLYAQGKRDFASMQISCVCCIELTLDRQTLEVITSFPLVYVGRSRVEFAEKVMKADLVCSFNGRRFDFLLLQDSWYIEIPQEKSFDLMLRVLNADGRNGYDWRAVKGFSLQNLSMANFNIGKSSTGSSAPIAWQNGEADRVISYCLRDVQLLTMLFLKILKGEPLKHPVYDGQVIKVKPPFRPLLAPAPSPESNGHVSTERSDFIN